MIHGGPIKAGIHGKDESQWEKDNPPYGQYPKGKGHWDSSYPQPKEDPLPTWDFNNPSAMLRDHLEELAFGNVRRRFHRGNRE